MLISFVIGCSVLVISEPVVIPGVVFSIVVGSVIGVDKISVVDSSICSVVAASVIGCVVLDPKVHPPSAIRTHV